MPGRLNNSRGLGLIELMVLLIVVSILIAIAMQSMTVTLSDFRRVKTEREMEILAVAITGDPEKTADGARTDFGYVGDNGSFPPDLDALRSNPGGYLTWQGAYLPPDLMEDTLGFKTDEWGAAYAYSGGTTIQSAGSGSTISKEVARSTADYLFNSLSGTIVDSAGTAPGGELDSVRLVVTIPNGAGAYTTKSYNPDSTGNFTLDSLPVGQHTLDVIYTTANDTLHRFIHILPRHRTNVRYKFGSAWFDSSTVAPSQLEYVPGTAVVTGSGNNCDAILFDIRNPGPSDIAVTSLSLTYVLPVSYYKSVRLGTTNVFTSQNPRQSSGGMITFSAMTIGAGQTVTIEFSNFCDNLSGACSNRSNMSNVSFTADFSDGSSVNFSVGVCP